MHSAPQGLELSFPAIPVSGRETPWSLVKLLYKSGPSIPFNQVNKAMSEGALGCIVPERVELVRLIHEFISGELTGGGSAVTARKQVREIAYFFAWAEGAGFILTVAELEKTYFAWAESLWQRVNVSRDIKSLSAYNYLNFVGHIIDGALGRAKPIVQLTRLKRPPTRKTPQGAEADKQNLERTFAFGWLLQEICDGILLSVVWGKHWEVSIPRRQGDNIKLAHGRKSLPDELRTPSNLTKARKVAEAYATDRTLSHAFRKLLVNLRIQAELLMFIGQTGMNLAQVQGLTLRRFSYSSDINGYKVRAYKPRRKGEVLFELFSEYRSHFERYLDWRRELFPKTEMRLFPLIRQGETREASRINFESLQVVCKKAGVTWTPPSSLRGTRVNWLLRRSGDPDLTADIAQHHEQTLLGVYERPSMQRAVVEITRFHARNDPTLAGTGLALAVAPGECFGSPKPTPAKPKSAPEPDCVRPSGCLWCEHHRDIDSFDYVWSLACFRHLKLLELSKQGPATEEGRPTHPAEHSVQRLSEKLSWFRESNDMRREWVEESLARVDEGHYHDQWNYLIEPIETAA